MISRQWTSSEIKSAFPSANNLGDVLGFVSEEITKNGEVLCEVRVNDVLLSEDEEQKYSCTPISEITSLDIKASTPQSLLEGSLQGCRDYLERLAGAFEKTADLFRGEHLHKAHDFYGQCIDGADWFVQLVTHYKVVYQSLRGPVSIDWLQAEVQLMEVLNEVLGAYEKKDYILLADLLEYEVTTVINTWRALLDSTENEAKSPVR